MLYPKFYLTMNTFEFQKHLSSSNFLKIRQDGNAYRPGSILDIQEVCNMTGLFTGSNSVIQLSSIIVTGSPDLDKTWLIAKFIIIHKELV